MRVDQEDFDVYMGKDPIEIGHDVSIRMFHREDGRPAGLTEAHKDAGGHPCIGTVTFVIPGVAERGNSQGALWDVLQLEPLTLSPSILCRSCGKHGYIRNGRWEPA